MAWPARARGLPFRHAMSRPLALSIAHPRPHLPLFARAALLAVVAAVAGSLWLTARIWGHHLGWFGLPDEIIHVSAHIVVWGSLGVLTVFGLGRRYLLGGLTVIAISGMDELHQGFVPGRFATWNDFVINVGAVIVFLIVARMIESYWTSRPLSPGRA